ncbi:unnamed protein product [marine sediment metagenome]|uniref:Uncharacterized protein n=1 Tax=marine sediment metagenome TaxID=412755 RepID=X1QNE6_9ZZZZ
MGKRGYGQSWKDEGHHHEEDPIPEENKKQKNLKKWIKKNVN